jgi:uncharacterized glyoxalase superfamily protein PhnB
MSEQQSQQVFYPAMRFLDGERAIRWLTEAFGFEESASYRDERGVIIHAEMRFHGALMFFGQERESDYPVKPPGEAAPPTGSVYVAVPPEDIEAHYERAKRAGARIFRELCDTEYGSREYSAYDCEGHPWSFGTYRP